MEWVYALVDGIASLIESSMVPSSRFVFDSIIGRWRSASMSALARSVFVFVVGSITRETFFKLKWVPIDELILELIYIKI